MSQKKSSVKHTPQPTSSTSTYILAGVALVVVVVVVVVAILWQRGDDAPRNDGYGSVKDPAVVSTVLDDGVVQLGRPEAPNTVDLFEDPMCPFCGQLEVKHGQELAQKIDEGIIAVRYHMVVLPQLDAVSASKNYSTRAVAASHCVAASENAVVYSAFHSGLFDPDFQPEENADTDRSDSELADLARSSGASEKAATCITSGSMAAESAADAAAAREALAASGAQGTPGVLVNANLVDALRDSGWVESIS